MANQNPSIPIQTFAHIEKIRTILKRSEVSYDDVLESENSLNSIGEETQAFIQFLQKQESKRTQASAEDTEEEKSPKKGKSKTKK